MLVASGPVRRCEYVMAMIWRYWSCRGVRPTHLHCIEVATNVDTMVRYVVSQSPSSLAETIASLCY